MRGALRCSPSLSDVGRFPNDAVASSSLLTDTVPTIPPRFFETDGLVGNTQLVGQPIPERLSDLFERGSPRPVKGHNFSGQFSCQSFGSCCCSVQPSW